MRLFDLHSHTTRCHHASGAVEQYIERAIELDFFEFGISDHSPWMIQHPDEPMAMSWAELPGYVSEIQRLQERYQRDGEKSFRLRLGMEMDFVPSRLDVARETIRRYPWDYLIGSIHNVGIWSINCREEAIIYKNYSIADICEVYFHQIGEMVRERFCDVIGHLDLPKKMGYGPKEGCLRWIEPLIPAIRQAGMAVEINTSGKDSPGGECFPSWDVVEALAAGGVMLTLGGGLPCAGRGRPSFSRGDEEPEPAGREGTGAL